MVEVFLIGGLVGGIGYLIVLNPKIGFGAFIAVCILGIAIGYFEDSGSSNLQVTGSNSSSSKAVRPEYGCLKNDCINGEGVYAYSGGGSYEGGFKDGDYHGEGSLYWKDVGSYVGGWKDGKKHGQGTYSWQDGDLYKGGWKEDLKHGEGIYTWKGGNSYRGTWKDGIKDGKGVNIYADGSKTSSFFEDGVDSCLTLVVFKVFKCPGPYYL